MKMNYRRDLKSKKKLGSDDFERREGKVKSLKAERKERHKAKNQRAHQYTREFFLDQEEY